MKILNKIKRKFLQVISRKGFNSNWVSLGGFNSNNGGVNKSYVYACCAARAENISKARIYLYRRVKTSGGPVEIFDHPFLDLMNSPNVFEQGIEVLLYLISVSLDLFGNAYVLVDRDKKGIPASMYFLPFSSTSIKLNLNNTRIDYYEYREGSKTYKIPKTDIIHFKIPNPESNIYGKSIISAFNFTLDIEYLQNLYQKNFYLHDASPGLILETDEKLSEYEMDRVKKQVEDRYEGAVNAGRTLILGEGLKTKPLNAHPKDAGLVESRTMVRDEILAIMRVPKPILGITTEVNFANAREALKIFNDYTVRPFARLCIESKFNNFIRQNYKDNNLKMVMEFEFEQDRQTQLKTYETYRKWNIATVNEIRELEGFERINSNEANKL